MTSDSALGNSPDHNKTNEETENLSSTESFPTQQTALDRKILDHFPGLVVRKDLTYGLKQNAVVPTYVLEYLLGQHCSTDDAEVVEAGLDSVQRILARHYVHRYQANTVQSAIMQSGQHKVIDKVAVTPNDKTGGHEADFTNLGLRKVAISNDLVNRYKKLLAGGIWCIADVEYALPDMAGVSPWRIDALKPIQVPRIDIEQYLQAREQFTTDEWIDVLMQSIGFDPAKFGRRAKLLALVRLVPFCERNYNMLELGPKGTGKSHIYSEFSPHGMLISGSEVTVPKLFVNNSTNRIGLVGFWDCICFDEFAGKDKRSDKGLIDIMKGYMANHTFSRGVEQLSGEASMVFMGNTKRSVAYMLKHSHFFEPLPDKYIDSAFLDRLHAYNPGWEVAPIKHDLFSKGYGFIVDYLAEILKGLRSTNFSEHYKKYFEVASEVSTRDQTGFEKTFSGLMKLLHPGGNATEAEVEELLSFAMELRRRVRTHLVRIDETFPPHDFVYRNLSTGTEKTVLPPEEAQYPEFDGKAPPASAEVLSTEALPKSTSTEEASAESEDAISAAAKEPEAEAQPGQPQPGHTVLPENTQGWSYRKLFADHLKGATEITVCDPYIQAFHQIRNMMEFLTMVYELVEEGEEVKVHLITQLSSDLDSRQEENLHQVAESLDGTKVEFTWEFDPSPNFHARSITTDTGWKIILDRGLDIFQWYQSGPFSLQSNIQEARQTRGTEITFVKL